jgi:hypothetical protein
VHLAQQHEIRRHEPPQQFSRSEALAGAALEHHHGVWQRE